jgi:phage baseplate assembly protein W
VLVLRSVGALHVHERRVRVDNAEVAEVAQRAEVLLLARAAGQPSLLTRPQMDAAIARYSRYGQPKDTT